MAEDLGADTAAPLPADETPVPELELGSGDGYSEWEVDSRGSEVAGATKKCGSSTSDVGEKLGAPNNGFSETQEMQEMVGGVGEKLDNLVIMIEHELGREMDGETAKIDKKHRDPKSTDRKAKQGCEITGSMYGRRYYSRSEMEELRLVDAEEQRRRWMEVYRGLGSVIAREYDGISQQQKQKQKRKKKQGATIIGEVSAESTPTGLSAQSISDLVCADALVGQDNGEAIEELCSEYTIDIEDDNSDDERVSMQRPAFLVEGEPDFESGPPLDGLEYLRRVRWEAARIPKVKVAKLDSSKLHSEQTPYLPNIPVIAKCPPNLLPSKHWEAAFLSEFSEIRQAFSRLEGSLDESPFPKCSENPSKQSDGTQQPKRTPTVAAMLGMDAVSRAVALRKSVGMLETASPLSRDDCLWLFALCAAVDAPLDAETCAALRCLLRKCSSLLAGKSELDDEVAMLIVLTTIAGKYFGQSEK